MRAVLDRLQAIRRRRSQVGFRGYYSQSPTCQVPHLWHLFSLYLGERNDGYFVEVGAHDGYFVSNTWGLAERGWNGLAIEPVPSLAAQLRLNHTDHRGVQIVECAVGAPDTKELTLRLAGALTTANAELFEEYHRVNWARGHLSSRTIAVPCCTLDSLLALHGVSPGFDVLVVDVEGLEVEVFKGFDLTEWVPLMMIVELVDTHPDLQSTASTDALLGDRLRSFGYQIVFKDATNTVLVRHDIWQRAHINLVHDA